MTEKQKREIRLSIGETELCEMLNALSRGEYSVLAVKVNTAWLDEPKAKEAEIQKDAQFAEGLQTIRGDLFHLLGYLKSAAPSRLAISWAEKAIKTVTSLQQSI